MGNPTKELCHKLDELGVEYDTYELLNGEHGVSWIDGNDIEWEVVPLGENFEIHALQLVTPEQAVAATVGRGNLTAEQVREAIMSADRWRKPMGDTGMTNTHLIIRDDGWQAIADEMNATLGAGTCHMNKETLDGITTLHCSKCGHELFLEFDRENAWFAFQYPRFCPNCGRRVVFE